jgi:hypothetical protein
VTEVSFKDQLMQLKAMTVRVGSLHEAQVLQLRNYPLLIPGVIKAETEIDPSTKLVRYKCESDLKKFRKTQKVKDFCKNIEVWIRTIIWDDTIVEIYVNGKSIFDSRINNDRSDKK